MVAIRVAMFQRTDEKIKRELILVGDLVSAPNTPSHFIVRLVVVKVEGKTHKMTVNNKFTRQNFGPPMELQHPAMTTAELQHPCTTTR